MKYTGGDFDEYDEDDEIIEDDEENLDEDDEDGGGSSPRNNPFSPPRASALTGQPPRTAGTGLGGGAGSAPGSASRLPGSLGAAGRTRLNFCSGSVVSGSGAGWSVVGGSLAGGSVGH